MGRMYTNEDAKSSEENYTFLLVLHNIVTNWNPRFLNRFWIVYGAWLVFAVAHHVEIDLYSYACNDFFVKEYVGGWKLERAVLCWIACIASVLDCSRMSVLLLSKKESRS